MAIDKKQIPPLDFDNSKAIGIDLPFNGPAVFKSNYKTKDALKSDLINFLLTDPGERYLNPFFGAGIRAYIFGKISENSLDFIEKDLTDKIQQYFPNVNIENLEVLRKDNSNQIIIKLFYSISNTNLTDNITLSFE